MKFLFDLGGVFFDWDPSYYFESIFSTSEEVNYFLQKICNSNWNIQQDKGRLIIDAENELISKFPKYEKEIKMYYANHRKMIKKTYQSSIDILYILKSHNYPCYVLSNWSAETFAGMEEDYPFLKKFDDLLISGAVNMVKPDNLIYELAISRFNLIPENTVFIDDKIENIRAAKKLNFKVIHLLDPKNIKKQINKFIHL